MKESSHPFMTRRRAEEVVGATQHTWAFSQSILIPFDPRPPYLLMSSNPHTDLPYEMGIFADAPDFVNSQLDATIQDLIEKTPGGRAHLVNKFSGYNRSARGSSLLAIWIQLICKPTLKHAPSEHLKAGIHLSPRIKTATLLIRPGCAKELRSLFALILPTI